MKFMNFIIVVGLGVVFFSLMGGHFRLPPSLVPWNSRKTIVQVDANEAKPTVHVRNLLRVRGKVIAVQGNAALVDCDVQGTPSTNSMANLNHATLEDGDSARAAFAALAQAEADMRTFGELKMIDDRNTFRPAQHTPGPQPRGKVLLQGLPVGVGDAVHVVTMMVGTSQNGVPVHTARFALHPGAWMWKDAGRTMLDTKLSPQCAPAAPLPR